MLGVRTAVRKCSTRRRTSTKKLVKVEINLPNAFSQEPNRVTFAEISCKIVNSRRGGAEAYDEKVLVAPKVKSFTQDRRTVGPRKVLVSL